jgi:hypothetical protein
MLKIAVGQSDDVDAADAIREIVERCAAQLGGAIPGAALVFASIELDHQPVLDHLLATYPGVAIIGCTTDGEMSSVGGFSESSLVVVLFASDTIEFIAEVARDLSKDPRGSAAAAAAAALERCTQELRACVTTPESLTTSGVAVLDGLRAGLGESVAILGGLAGDQVKFVGTRQFYGAEVLRDAAPLLLLAGPIHVAHGVASGWSPIGARAEVTRAAANVVHTIGDQSALDFYRRYIGQSNVPTGEYALAVFEPGRETFYLRAPLGADLETGAVTFFGDIPLGAAVQITQTLREDIIAACTTSVQQALAAYPGERPAAALCFSCAGRRHILGSRAPDELAAVRAGLPPGLPVAGFYAYSEIGPTEPGRPAALHNETFVTLLLGEH